MSLQLVYLTCFLVGFVYAVFVSVIGHMGTDVDASGHDVSMDHGGHLGGDVTHFSPISPVIIGSFVTAFGAAGFIGVKWGLGATASIVFAVIAALVVDLGLFLAMEKLYSVTQASSEAVLADLVGKTAEAITPIPDAGSGEIAYMAKGSRYTAPAKSADGKPIARNTVVRIARIVGSTFFVEPAEKAPEAKGAAPPAEAKGGSNA